MKYKNRVDFLSIMPKNSICAELGVYAARFSYYIIKKTEPKKLYLIDPYWKKYGDFFPWGKDNNIWKVFSKAVKCVQKYDVNKCAIFVIEEDVKFFEDLPDRFFDWVYLDSSHSYNDTLEELYKVKKKIKKDGLICGHDYKENPKHKHHGVFKAIHKWLEENKKYELFLIDNYSQWIIKRKDFEWEIK